MSDSKISVIIPTYNRGWCIAEAVRSVLEQDYTLSDKKQVSRNGLRQFSANRQLKGSGQSIGREQSDEKNLLDCTNRSVEIIVVDDGSTDNTNEVLKPFLGRGLITLLVQENRGVSAARNFGIRQSSGEFVAFLDSDDLWMPDKLSCQIDFFENSPEAMICQTEEIWIRNGKRVNPKNKHKKLSGMIFEPSLNLCLVSPSAVMMRRDFFEIKGFFDETLPACEDYDLWLRTSVDMPVWLVDKPCIIKRGGHQDQLSANHSLDKYRISSILKLLGYNEDKFRDDIKVRGSIQEDVFIVNSDHNNVLSINKSYNSIHNTSNCTLSSDQREAALRVLHEKCAIYSQGCIKRGKIAEARYYRELEKIATI